MIKFLGPILSFLLAFFTTKFLIPKLEIFSKKNNIFDNPNERKIHKKSISNLGGLGIYIGCFFSLVFSILIYINFLDISFVKKDLLIILLGPFFFTLLGFFDDLYNINYKFRLFIQFLVSALIYIFLLKVNFYIDLNWFSVKLIYLPNFFSFLVAIIWISGMVNALNWFDGIDGLASSTSIIFSKFK